MSKKTTHRKDKGVFFFSGRQKPKTLKLWVCEVSGTRLNLGRGMQHISLWAKHTIQKPGNAKRVLGKLKNYKVPGINNLPIEPFRYGENQLT